MARRKLLIVGVAIIVAMAGLPRPPKDREDGGGGVAESRRRAGFGAGALFRGWDWGWGFGFPYVYPPVFVMGPGMFLHSDADGNAELGRSCRRRHREFSAPADVNARRPGPMKTPIPPAPPAPDRGRPLARIRQPEESRGKIHPGDATGSGPGRAAFDLAQVAMARGNYAEAASRLREAETAEPGWIDHCARHPGASSASRPSSPARSHGWNRMCKPIPKTATPGSCWAPSGSSPDEPPRPPTSSNDSTTPPANPDIALAAFLDASNQAGNGGNRRSEIDRFHRRTMPEITSILRGGLPDRSCLACATAVSCPSGWDGCWEWSIARSSATSRSSTSSWSSFPSLPMRRPIYETVEELRDRLAVPIPNEHTDRYVKKARERGVFIQTGTFLEVDPRWPGAVFNTTCLIGPDGLLSRYRKVNPWLPWEVHASPHDLPGMTSRCFPWSRPRSAGWARRSATTGCFPSRSGRWRSAGPRC